MKKSVCPKSGAAWSRGRRRGGGGRRRRHDRRGEIAMMPPRRMHENATLCIGGRAALSRRRHAGEPVEDMTDKRICMPLRSMRGKSVRYVFCTAAVVAQHAGKRASLPMRLHAFGSEGGRRTSAVGRSRERKRLESRQGIPLLSGSLHLAMDRISRKCLFVNKIISLYDNFKRVE